MSRPALPRIARHGLAAGLAALCAGALGAPVTVDDPVADLLHERGLAPPPAPVPAPAGNIVARARDRAGELVLSALNFLDVPYRRGGNGEGGFDCSGFTRHIFEASLGFVLPRRVDEQASAPGLVSVRRDELEPGDLVFFNTLRRTFSHVGIYVGDGKFIHSPRSGGRVRLEDMRQGYWTRRFTGARRAEPLRAPAPDATTAAAVAPRAGPIPNPAEAARLAY